MNACEQIMLVLRAYSLIYSHTDRQKPKSAIFCLGGFKFEAQRALVIDETPLRVF